MRTVSAAPGKVPAVTSAAQPSNGLADGLAEVGVGARVTGHELAQPEDVGDDLDLAGAAGTGADADGRDAQALGDGGRELLGHELQDDREGACLLDRQRVGQQRPAPSRGSCPGP